MAPAPKNPLRPIGSGLVQTRRTLPHWQQGGGTYFATFRTLAMELDRTLRSIVLAAARHFNGSRYTLWAVVVMPDHVHLLLTPMEDKPGQWWSLSRILHSLKGFTAKEINRQCGRSGAVWMQESFDRIVRDSEEFIEKWTYIRNNPVKKGLCAKAEDWDGFYEHVPE